MLSNEQLVELSTALNEALECVLTSYHEKIDMCSEVHRLERIHKLATELLGNAGGSNKHWKNS